jgi:serine/threonine-protein kinase
MSASAETLVIREPCERVLAPPRLGSFIGAYQIRELIGQGAIGLVYLAEHTKLKRKVALKVLRDELASNAKAVARFFGEARAVNEIAHENIVEITDFVEADADRGLPSHYIMELLEGRTLKEALENDRLQLDQILSIGMQIAGALGAVHDKAIVHRDLKPANIFLVTDDKRADFVKLLDFGVAKLSSALRSSEPDTGSGVLIGTPGYMSPEQIQGLAIDHRTDVYALGVVLFELVAGRPPFLEDDMLELLYKHCEADAPDPSDVSLATERIPRKLSQLILECLAKDPEDRPQSADEIYERLRAIRERRRLGRRLIPASWIAAIAASGIAMLGLGGKEDTAPLILVEEVAAEPEPEHVLVRFASDPPGAQVFLGEQLLGETPLTQVFDKTDQTASFSFARDGYEPEEELVPFSADVHVMVALKPLPIPPPEPPKQRTIEVVTKKIAPHPPPKKKKKRKSRISRAEIRNPFE